MGKLKNVVVLTNKMETFRRWVRDNGKENINYIYGNDRVERNLFGRLVHDVVKLHDWHRIKNIDEILDYIERHRTIEFYMYECLKENSTTARIFIMNMKHHLEQGEQSFKQEFLDLLITIDGCLEKISDVNKEFFERTIKINP